MGFDVADMGEWFDPPAGRAGLVQYWLTRVLALGCLLVLLVMVFGLAQD